MKRVHHASPVRGLGRIVPHTSTHGTPWVYALGDEALASMFLSGYGGDFACSIGRDGNTGKPYLCERFSGALLERYQGRTGSIYTLDGTHFDVGMTSWAEELVSSRPARVIHEMQVEDALDHLLELERLEEVLLIRYPQKIAGIPEDDEDLVWRACRWLRQHGDGVLKAVERFHPHLRDRVFKALRDQEDR